MNFKKWLAVILTAIIMFIPVISFADGVTDSIIETEPDIKYAEAALLMDMDSGRLLYSKNPTERLYPASTTKMMTGILALENGNMSDNVTATYEALKDITLEDSHMGILIGEELTIEQLVTGMLVYSANDAANVIAIHLAGSIEAFVEMMNNKAQELGMKNTHFVNACGTHDDNHYTTAEDLAILAKYCMQNEKFREIVKMPRYTIPATNKYTRERILDNTNLFLSTVRSSYYYYKPCIGIKTGHTSQAGYCLVSAAEFNGINLLAVVMKCDNADTLQNAYSYIDSKTLFEYGFNNYAVKELAMTGDVVTDSPVYEAQDNLRVSLTVPDEIKALIPANADADTDIVKEISLPERIDAPVKKGDILGSITYSYNGQQLGKTDLIAVNDVDRNEIIHAFHVSLRFITSPFFFIPAILIIILIIFSNHQRKKRERKRRIQQLKRNKQNNDTGYRTPDRKISRTEIQIEESKGSNSRYKEK